MPTCPACAADLTDSAATAESLGECPFCGAAWEQPLSAANDTAASGPGATHLAGSMGPLPPDSRIEVVEQSTDRLVLHVPPGGASTRGLGCFALVWNLFMLVFTPPWFLALGQGDGPPLLIIIPFLLVFWAVGLGMAYAWLRMRSTRTYLLVEPQRMVLQSQWLRNRSVEETVLTSDSRARLVESYQMNEVPVHRIEVDGDGRTLRFGTHLSEPEKEWLRDSINGWLGVDSLATPVVNPKFCSACGASLEAIDFEAVDSAGETPRCPQCGESQARLATVAPRRVLPVTSLAPRQLPADSVLQIEEDSPERLIFSLPLLPEGQVLRIASRAMTIVGLIWVGIAGTVWVQAMLPPPQQAMEWIGIVLRGIPLLPGAAILWAGLAIRRGRIRVAIDRDWFRVRYHASFIGKRQRLATASIDAVRLRTQDDFRRDDGSTRHTSIPGAEDVVVATVHCGTSFLPLTTLHARDVAESAAGLVKHRLQELGVRLSDSETSSELPADLDEDAETN